MDYSRLHFPQAERLLARNLTVTLHVGMTEAYVDAVAAAFERFVREARTAARHGTGGMPRASQRHYT